MTYLCQASFGTEAFLLFFLLNSPPPDPNPPAQGHTGGERPLARTPRCDCRPKIDESAGSLVCFLPPWVSTPDGPSPDFEPPSGRQVPATAVFWFWGGPVRGWCPRRRTWFERSRVFSSFSWFTSSLCENIQVTGLVSPFSTPRSIGSWADGRFPPSSEVLFSSASVCTQIDGIVPAGLHSKEPAHTH